MIVYTTTKFKRDKSLKFWISELGQSGQLAVQPKERDEEASMWLWNAPDLNLSADGKSRVYFANK